MQNFQYRNPTRIVFGKGSIAQLKTLIPAGERVLITYGGGSIKANGVYEQVKAALAGHTVFEFGGIQPNPLYETLMEAVKVVKREKITFLLAVGGGSVLDGTKFIGAAACYEGGDAWDIVSKGAPVKAAVPVASVLTLPATGSESNTFAVISRQSTQEKFGYGAELAYPQFAVLDPEATMSLPEKQSRNGIVDAYVHVMEQYATYPASAPLQDRQAEGILLTLIEEGPKVMKEPRNYDARANILWSATQALNGLIGQGVPQDWATHMIGHELTAFLGLDHAETLAIVMPALLRDQMAVKSAKLAQYARRVYCVQEAEEKKAAEAGVAKTEAFFHSLGMKTRLADYGISAEEAAKKVSERFAARGTVLGEKQQIDPVAVKRILLAC